MVLKTVADLTGFDKATLVKVVADMQFSGYETPEMRNKILMLYSLYDRNELYCKARFPYNYNPPVVRDKLQVKKEQYAVEHYRYKPTIEPPRPDIKIPAKEVWTAKERFINEILTYHFVWDVADYGDCLVVYLTDMSKAKALKFLFDNYKGEVVYAKHV